MNVWKYDYRLKYFLYNLRILERDGPLRYTKLKDKSGLSEPTFRKYLRFLVELKFINHKYRLYILSPKGKDILKVFRS